ncbi:hypothetical protein F4819DRAFT_481116 [Hypoxylon fuscum]|nr:hypothetical protein F4819DRAFT_481116 [Hypoxylon fuscum]
MPLSKFSQVAFLVATIGYLSPRTTCSRTSSQYPPITLLECMLFTGYPWLVPYREIPTYTRSSPYRILLGIEPILQMAVRMNPSLRVFRKMRLVQQNDSKYECNNKREP